MEAPLIPKTHDLQKGEGTQQFHVLAPHWQIQISNFLGEHSPPKTPIQSASSLQENLIRIRTLFI